MAQFMHQRGIFCMIHSAASKKFVKYFVQKLVEIPSPRHVLFITTATKMQMKKVQN